MEKKKNGSIFLYQTTDPGIVFIIAACHSLGLEIRPLTNMSMLWDLWLQERELVFVHSQMDAGIFDADTFLIIAGYSIGSYIDPLNIQSSDCHHDTQRVLDFLAISGYRKHVQDIANPKSWAKNKIAARYGKALGAAKIFMAAKDKQTSLSQLFENAAMEVLSGKENHNVSMFEQNFEKCETALSNAHAKLKISAKPFNIAKRKIAFAYLSNLSPWLDLERFQEEALSAYPFLVVIQYKKDEEEYTWIASKGKLNVRKIFDIRRDHANQYKALIRGSHAVMIRLLKEEAREFSS